jgi:uncharacterized protein (DUF488 family)
VRISARIEGVPHRLWTVGHSTHTLEEFVALLSAQEITLLCDVRTVPRSKRHPHVSTEALARSLPERGIEYRHLPGLGGWRHARPDSPNTAWRNAAFRGYADYALSAQFADALGELCDLAVSRRTAIMCAEALWWRCHRRLIADRLLAAGWEVCHIGSDGHPSPHRLTEFAEVQPDGSVVYPQAVSQR